MVSNSRSITWSASAKAFFYVTQNVLEMAGNVADFVGLLAELLGLKVVVQERSAILNGIPNGGHGFKDFVLDFDKVDGLLSDMSIDCSNSSHGVSRVQDFLAGQDVVTHEPEAHADLAHLHFTFLGPGGKSAAVTTAFTPG